MDTETESGCAVIRAAMWARRTQLATVARDLGTAAEALHAFTHNGAGLAPKILEALTLRIWAGSFIYDATIDRLQSANQAKPTPVSTIRAPMPTPPKWKAGLPEQWGYGGGIKSKSAPAPKRKWFADRI